MGLDMVIGVFDSDWRRAVLGWWLWALMPVVDPERREGLTPVHLQPSSDIQARAKKD